MIMCSVRKVTSFVLLFSLRVCNLLQVTAFCLREQKSAAKKCLFHNAKGDPGKLNTEKTRSDFFSECSHSVKLKLPLVATAVTVLLPQKGPAYAISPNTAATSYDSYASSYDSLDGGDAASALGIDEARLRLLSSAKGHVLEIGVGTGLNIPKYTFDSQKIQSITFVDVSEGMLREAKLKAAANIPKQIKVNFIHADATSQLVDLFGSEAFDTVLDTFSLCVMGTEGAEDCLKQMKAVVKKESDGGQILLLENTRSSNPLLGLYQDVTAEAAATIGGKGCVYNQDVTAMILKNKLSIQKDDEYAAGLFRSFVCVRL